MFAEYLDQNVCLKQANDECAVVSVVRLDAWIYFGVVITCFERSVNLGGKQKRIQKKNQNALSTHLPLAVQQILSGIRRALSGLKNDALLVTMGVANSDDNTFTNLLQNCTEIV